MSKTLRDYRDLQAETLAEYLVHAGKANPADLQVAVLLTPDADVRPLLAMALQQLAATTGERDRARRLAANLEADNARTIASAQALETVTMANASEILASPATVVFNPAEILALVTGLQDLEIRRDHELGPAADAGRAKLYRAADDLVHADRSSRRTIVQADLVDDADDDLAPAHLPRRAAL